MIKTTIIFLLAMTSRAGAQNVTQSVIQGPKCIGVLHGVVYEPSGQRAMGVRVTAWPFGVDLGAVLPDATSDKNGEYRFEHVCHGKYTVIADDTKAGYPSTFPDGSEFLYGTRIASVRLNALHRDAELAVHLPPKPGRVLLHIRDAETMSEILKFELKLSIPGQRRTPEESIQFGDSAADCEIPIPSGKDVTVHVKAEGYKEVSRSILVPSGAQTTLNLEVESLNPPGA